MSVTGNIPPDPYGFDKSSRNEAARLLAKQKLLNATVEPPFPFAIQPMSEFFWHESLAGSDVLLPPKS